MKQQLCILWDASHIWGLMAWRAATALRLPFRLLKASEIAQGALACKPPALLLAPGGTARLKAAALGPAGKQAIRDFVANGGAYLGFCGGAGLGLTGDGGLGLCPWQRAPYVDRLQHLVSGHVLAKTTAHPLCPEAVAAPPAREHGGMRSLPVWWPGRFAPPAEPDKGEGNGVRVLAAYSRPDRDLCLADIPLASLPQDIFGAWQALYGINMRADFLTDQPCILQGTFGRGTYVLSYSHLETPDSPDANAWLAHLLRTLAGLTPHGDTLPPWDVDRLPTRWPKHRETTPLFRARAGLMRLMRLGTRHNLIFRRTPWLRGWRTGIPGAALNNLHAALCTALSLPPTAEALRFWQAQKDRVRALLPLFIQGTEGYLLAERLGTTLAAGLPDVVDRRGLKAQREALFGRPMEGGGLYQELLDIADELVFLLAREASCPEDV